MREAHTRFITEMAPFWGDPNRVCLCNHRYTIIFSPESAHRETTFSN